MKDPDAPQRYMAEIKSALVSNLASHGEISEAIKIYEEIKQEEFQPESKAVVCLIVCPFLSSEISFLKPSSVRPKKKVFKESFV